MLRKGHYHHKGNDLLFLWSLTSEPVLLPKHSDLSCILNTPGRGRRPHIVGKFLSDPDNDANSPETCVIIVRMFRICSKSSGHNLCAFPIFCVLFCDSVSFHPPISSFFFFSPSTLTACGRLRTGYNIDQATFVSYLDHSDGDQLVLCVRFIKVVRVVIWFDRLLISHVVPLQLSFASLDCTCHTCPPT